MQSSENTESSNQESGDNISNDSSNEDNQRKARFTKGDEIKLVRVRFPGNAKSFPFLIGKRTFAYGQKVMAMSDRGMTVGYINSFPYASTYQPEMEPLRSIASVATDEDIEMQRGFYMKEMEAERACLKLIEKYELDMNLTHVEFIQFGKKAVFYFNAPARVDFRNLVKDLVGELRMRIELRQISVRDRTAALGAIGACGLQTCCSSFLQKYGNVSIKMAKNQNLALIPSKINGVCGQIKCCMKYEDEVYTNKRKSLPTEGSFIKTKNGDKGKVLRLDLLVERFEMITDRGQIRKYVASQFHEGEKLGREYKFPEKFQHVVNETSTIIGLEEPIKASESAKPKTDNLKPVVLESSTNDKSNDSDNRTKDSESENKSNRPRRNNRNRNRNRNRNNKKPENKSVPTNQKDKKKE